MTRANEKVPRISNQSAMGVRYLNDVRISIFHSRANMPFQKTFAALFTLIILQISFCQENVGEYVERKLENEETNDPDFDSPRNQKPKQDAVLAPTSTPPSPEVAPPKTRVREAEDDFSGLEIAGIAVGSTGSFAMALAVIKCYLQFREDAQVFWNMMQRARDLWAILRASVFGIVRPRQEVIALGNV